MLLTAASIITLKHVDRYLFIGDSGVSSSFLPRLLSTGNCATISASIFSPLSSSGRPQQNAVARSSMALKFLEIFFSLAVGMDSTSCRCLDGNFYDLYIVSNATIAWA